MLLLVSSGIRLFRKMSTFDDYWAVAVDIDVDCSARLQLINRLVYVAWRHWFYILTRN